MLQNNQKKQWLSQQIYLDPLNVSNIKLRSEISLSQKDYHQAISDVSKLIMLSPSRQSYVERSQLYGITNKFKQAVRDLQTAKNYKKINIQQTAVDIFFSSSVCMSNISEVQQLADLSQQAKDPERYVKTLRQLLIIKQYQLQQEKKQRKIELQKIKKQYEAEQKNLKKLLIDQIAQVKQQLGLVVINYIQKYQIQLKKKQISQQHKYRLMIYIQTFVSQMQKYYVAAKNLGKIQQKTLRIQDFQEIRQKQLNKNFIQTIYRLFDKYNHQIEKIQHLITNIPYIGAAFKMIKVAMKAKGWTQNIDIQHQCKNIQKMAPNLTIFNQFSGYLGYQLVKHYQQTIIVYKKLQQRTRWEQITHQYNQIKNQRIGKQQYYTKLTQQEESIKNLATLHASIIMVAQASNHLSLTKQKIHQTNRIHDQIHQQGIISVFDIIDQVSLALKISAQQACKQNQNINQVQKSKRCCIY